MLPLSLSPTYALLSNAGKDHYRVAHGYASAYERTVYRLNEFVKGGVQLAALIAPVGILAYGLSPLKEVLTTNRSCTVLYLERIALTNQRNEGTYQSIEENAAQVRNVDKGLVECGSRIVELYQYLSAAIGVAAFNNLDDIKHFVSPSRFSKPHHHRWNNPLVQLKSAIVGPQEMAKAAYKHELNQRIRSLLSQLFSITIKLLVAASGAGAVAYGAKRLNLV